MKQGVKALLSANGPKLRRNAFHAQAVLRTRERVFPFGLSVPTRTAGESLGNVATLDIQR